MVRCNGCYRNFETGQALRSHMQQVQNFACQQAYLQQVDAILQNLESNYAIPSEFEPVENPEDDSLAEPHDGPDFAGDLFGAYDINELPGLNDDNEEMEAEFTTSIDDSSDSASDTSNEPELFDLEYPDSDDDDDDSDFYLDESIEAVENDPETLQ